MLGRSHGSTQTLAQLVRSYAQPVNPRWFVTGDLYLAKLRTEAEHARALARERVHSARTSFDAGVERAVAAALARPFLSDVTDYAGPTVDASARYVARSPVVPGENRFWTRAAGWPGYVVDGAGGAAWGPLAVVLVLGWFALRGRR
jgi:hypothetical protein